MELVDDSFVQILQLKRGLSILSFLLSPQFVSDISRLPGWLYVGSNVHTFWNDCKKAVILSGKHNSSNGSSIFGTALLCSYEPFQAREVVKACGG